MEPLRYNLEGINWLIMSKLYLVQERKYAVGVKYIIMKYKDYKGRHVFKTMDGEKTVNGNKCRNKSMASRHKLRTKGHKNDYKDKSEKNKSVKRPSRNLEGYN